MKSHEQKAVGHTSATPGPWVYAFGAIYQGSDANEVEESTGRLLQADRDNPHTQPTERDANCRLAACAPEMLEALELVLMTLRQYDIGHERQAEICAIIALAKGEA